MKKDSRISLILVLSLVLIGCFAMNLGVSAKEVTVRAGHIMYVENVNTLDPAKLNTGDNVELITTSDVVVDDVVIIESGTPVTATIKEAQGEGAMGKAGKLTIGINSVQAVDGTVIGLSGTKSLAGESKKTEAVGGGLFLCAPMLLMQGEGVALPAHSKLEARVTGTYDIDGIAK